MLAWLGALALVLAGRSAAGAQYRRNPTGSQQRWLLVCRLGILAHGIVWGMAGMLPLAEGDGVHRAIAIATSSPTARGSSRCC